MDTVRSIFDAFARRDAEAVRELTAPDAQFHAVTAEIAGREGPYRGPEGIALYFSDVASIWEEIELTPIDFEQVGELTLVTGRVWARGSGRVVDSSTGWLFRIEDGLLAWGRVFESAAAAVEAAQRG